MRLRKLLLPSHIIHSWATAHIVTLLLTPIHRHIKDSLYLSLTYTHTHINKTNRKKRKHSVIVKYMPVLNTFATPLYKSFLPCQYRCRFMSIPSAIITYTHTHSYIQYIKLNKRQTLNLPFSVPKLQQRERPRNIL